MEGGERFVHPMIFEGTRGAVWHPRCRVGTRGAVWIFILHLRIHVITQKLLITE